MKKHPKIKNKDIYGRLTVIKAYCRKDKNYRSFHLCQCICGNKKIITDYSLKVSTRSCGCIQKEVVSKTNSTHKMRLTSEYNIWSKMKSRCESPGQKSYKYYGAKGIKVCKRWQKFENFFADMGQRPTLKHSIDRKDNSKGYCPDNCRWATPKEQGANKTNNKKITIGTETKHLEEWVRISGTPQSTIKNRLNRGWSNISAVFGADYLEYKAKDGRIMKGKK